MASSNVSNFEFIQKIFGDKYSEVEATAGKVHSEAMFRRGLAYLLKGIAAFGGLAITAGVPKDVAHGIGIIIAVAIAVDGLFLNHMRLIAVVKADKAYKYLLRDVRDDHQVAQAPMLGIADENTKLSKLSDLNLSFKTRLDKESKIIDMALDEVDIKALNALSVDTEKNRLKHSP